MWIIERDKNDQPLRMVWYPGADEYAAQRNHEIEAAKAKASLPMPSMRKWLEDHKGLK